MTRPALRSAIAISVLVTATFMGVTPASSGQPQEVAYLDVTKVVDGTAPADAEFVIEVSCTKLAPPPTNPAVAPRGAPPNIPPFTVDLVYGATGGTQTVVLGDAGNCTITETDNGGADSNTGPVDVLIAEAIPYDASITNTFDPDPTTTEAPTTTTTAAAQAAQAQPTFTG